MRCSLLRSALFFLLMPFFLFREQVPAMAGGSHQTEPGNPLKACQLLTAAEAEKILGQAVKLTHDKAGVEGDLRICRFGYISLAKDPASGQQTQMFVSLEQKVNNPSAEQARQVLETVRVENTHDLDLTMIQGVGEEAFLLSDRPSLYLFMARKGGIIMRLQIRSATEKTSVENLKAFAEKVAKQL